jgi:3-hydroxyisobutyrate dehydrogenase-like beta-hydroxyacid dehydrogenase
LESVVQRRIVEERVMGERVGFIGLGNMGAPIAANLIASGYEVSVYNRTASKADPLVEKGASRADHPRNVLARGGVVFTMLADDRAVEEIVFGKGFPDALGPDGVHVSMSTISPALSRRLAARHAQSASAYVAAPVFGRPEAAAARKLWICLAGPPAARERVRPLLAALGQGLFDFGDEPAAANVVKLSGNFLIAAAMEAMAEAFALAEKNGIAPDRIADVFGQTLFACPIYKNYGAAIAGRRFAPAGFRLSLGLKDVELALAASDEKKVPMPVASLLRDRLLGAVARGRQDLDWSALAIGAREDAGLS